ncbi:MAG: mechanosensitive ion channel [Eubacterium sp.]|nr:mechanosensitive ion channel [Eubacterium sp.]MCM1214393.1 mechanosensitive ion channel [Lachnospiraceae bacterium]MCM1304475.1 mechanosensitive ion channel [Butyrivibrio sp.]MCM1342593.1 mechanosensitive ion channel [Muribaculaceae bacterium]MCM1238684.1 mechanosensitive ion channel [Lachnospiraceae bacterium]
MRFIDSFLAAIGNGIWSVIAAALILVAAFVVAAIVKSLVLKLLGKGKVGEFFDKLDSADGDGKGGSTKEFIGKLVHLLVFLLFVPGIFSVLGMREVISPITGLLNTVWGYIPNIVAAVIVLVVGCFVAKLVRQLLIPVFNKLNVDKLQEKAGVEVPSSAKLSGTLAYIVYVLILIPMIVMALDVLNISVISTPAVHMLDMIFSFIPNIFVGLVIIVIGCMIGKFVSQIVTRLIASAGLDEKLSKLLDEEKNAKFELSKFVGTVVNVVVVIFFVVEGVNVLKLEVLTDIGAAVIGYMPAVLSAVLILAICFVAGSAASRALVKRGHVAYGLIAKCAILTVGVFMVLSQLGIAEEIVNTTFKLVLAALAVAFAIAFGMGGKEFASRTLKKLEDSMENGADKKE